MKSFVIKQTDDGLCHLYSYDSARGKFAKIKTAAVVELVTDPTDVLRLYYYDREEGFKKYADADERVKDPTHALVWNRNALVKSLFTIEHDEIFETFLSREAKVAFVEGVCIYERDNLWYVNNNTKKEILLGEKHSMYLSGSEIDNTGKLRWDYFLCKKGSLTEIKYFNKGEVVKIGPYLGVDVRDDLASIFCKTQDGFYDIYRLTSNGLIKQKNKEIIWLKEGCYIWFEGKQEWSFYEDFRLWCDNVIYRCYGNELKDLCEVGKDSIRIVAKDGWLFGKDFIGLNGIRYYMDMKTRTVDFNNPQPEPNIWQKIFRLFKKN